MFQALTDNLLAPPLWAPDTPPDAYKGSGYQFANLKNFAVSYADANYAAQRLDKQMAKMNQVANPKPQPPES